MPILFRGNVFFKFFIFIILITQVSAVMAGPQVQNSDTQQAEIVGASYNRGKRSFAEGDFPLAVRYFNQVVELEKGSQVIHTPEAKDYIRQAQEKIRQTQTAGVSRASEYTINEGDTLFIYVLGEDELKQEVTVRPDGRISFPLAGDIPAEGLTFAQLKEELVQGLKGYIKFPEVSVSLRKMGGRKIIILGEVAYPGVYTPLGKTSLLEAIALAGGFNDSAVVSSVIVIRGGLLEPKGMRLNLNLNRPLLKADMSQNIYLQPEDIVFIPKKFIADVNYFVSQIIGPISSGSANIYTTQGLREKRW